jgi:hypothetical protein
MMSETVTSWLTGRLPAEWFEGSPEVTVDRDEILVVGRLATPEGEDAPAASRDHAQAASRDHAQRAAESGRIARFREDTREQRMRIAREAEHHFGRKVAWGAVCGETRATFTSLSVPVMTRLRQPERVVLDTLVEAGVARSRSDALVWCVRLVGEHTGDWLTALRDALQSVQKVRDAGPEAAAG